MVFPSLSSLCCYMINVKFFFLLIYFDTAAAAVRKIYFQNDDEKFREPIIIKVNWHLSLTTCWTARANFSTLGDSLIFKSISRVASAYFHGGTTTTTDFATLCRIQRSDSLFETTFRRLAKFFIYAARASLLDGLGWVFISRIWKMSASIPRFFNQK